MSEHYIHIPTPMETNSVYRQVLEKLVDGLNHGTPGMDGKILVITPNLEPQMSQSILRRLEERGWSVTVQPYCGQLHWRFRAA